MDKKEMKLVEFCEINPKTSLKKSEVAKKIAMTDLSSFSRKIRRYTWEKYAGGTKFQNGDTLMARITPCLENGKGGYVDLLDKNEVAFGSTEYIIFRRKENVSYPEFIYYYINTKEFRDIAIKLMTGTSGRQRVQTELLANMEFVFPDYKSQCKIANILSLIDKKIDANSRLNDNLEEVARTIFKEYFTFWVEDYIQDTGKLSDIADILMGQSPSGNSYNEDGHGEVFYQGKAEFGWRFPKRRLYTTEPKRMARENSILMSVRAPVGDINLANEYCCIGRGLAAIYSKNNNQSYLTYLIDSLKNKLDIYNREGTVFGSINKESLANLEINIPNNDKIEEFEKIVEPIDKQIRTLSEENIRLENLRDTLLPELMSGKIDIDGFDFEM